LTELSGPLITINFKAYFETEGAKALEMARICGDVSESSGITIAVCPPAAELGFVARNIDIPVLSQNADPRTPGSSTGWMTPSMIKAAGAVGSLINHSEHKQSSIAEIVGLSKELSLVTVVCADTSERAKEYAAYHPDFIAVEPPELIGGDVSVTDANPGVVEDTVSNVRSVSRGTSVLCGAGIKTGKDVLRALELGADGVLLASGVVRSKDPAASLADLVKYL
jgi:triosephosphate isomerase